MASELINVPINLQTGSRTFGPVSIPDDLTLVRIRLARRTSTATTVWSDETTTIDCVFQISLDGGQSWQDNDGFSAKGGVAPRRGGGDSPETVILTQIPRGTNRRGRVAVTVRNGPLVSNITVEAL